MRAYHLDEFGTLEGIVAREDPTPAVGAHDVLVRVRARSLNYRDLLILRKAYPLPGAQGVVPLSDGAGEVVQVGAGVSRVAVGDRVAATYFPRWRGGLIEPDFGMDQFGCTRDGVLADFLVADEQALVKVPAHLSFVEAATLPCAAVTAWSALNGPRRVLPGETVLTIGTGGVALFALQFAKLFGARTIAITSSPEKVERLKALGADDVIDRKENETWHLAVRELTGGRGVDHVVETGSIETLPKSLAACGWNAEVAMVLALLQGAIDVSAMRGLFSARRLFVGSRATFEAMNRAIEKHQLRPVVDRVFAFEDARGAYGHFEAQRHIGKVIISDEI
jgi:NADPH:quinone reductase-like Zn-dependent oxidoreductase